MILNVVKIGEGEADDQEILDDGQNDSTKRASDCHPEQSEGTQNTDFQILHCVQNNKKEFRMNSTEEASICHPERGVSRVKYPTERKRLRVDFSTTLRFAQNDRVKRL